MAGQQTTNPPPIPDEYFIKVDFDVSGKSKYSTGIGIMEIAELIKELERLNGTPPKHIWKQIDNFVVFWGKLTTQGGLWSSIQGGLLVMTSGLKKIECYESLQGSVEHWSVNENGYYHKIPLPPNVVHSRLRDYVPPSWVL